MMPALMGSALILYDYIQVIVALGALILAIRWKKWEFMGGLFFLLLYSIFEILDVVILSLYQDLNFDIAQFGFILLAIIFFIIGMNPSWASRRTPLMSPPEKEDISSGNESIMSVLRKL